MKTFKTFDTAQKPLVKKFVNTLTNNNLPVNHKAVEAFYYNILCEENEAFDAYIRYQRTSGSGRFTSAYKDTSKDIIPVLNAMSIGYSIGNDAPKGGKHGDYIFIKNEERKRITFLYNNFINN